LATGSWYAAQVSLLPVFLEWWDYRCKPSRLAESKCFQVNFYYSIKFYTLNFSLHKVLIWLSQESTVYNSFTGTNLLAISNIRNTSKKTQNYPQNSKSIEITLAGKETKALTDFQVATFFSTKVNIVSH
jgi:hypothetical protein